MADNDVKEEFHVDNNNLETSCQLSKLMADDEIYEEFDVDQEMPLDIWVTYVRFIERLRVRLGARTRRTHGLPVLTPQLQEKPPIKWLNLRLRANKRELTLLIRQDNLTLIGFQRQDCKEVLELGYTGNPHIIDGSTFIEVSHYYPDLLQKAELDSVRDIKLGQPQLIRAISELNSALKIRAYHLIVIMQMICESIKFSRISDHLATIFAPPGSGSGPPLWMEHLTHSWENLSAALQRADAHPDHRLPSNKIGFKSFAEAINVLGIVKYYSFNHHHPLSLLRRDYHMHGKSLFGQPKVEVFEVRIDNINSGSGGEDHQGDIYGTVIIRDGLISQHIFNRTRDNAELMNPGDSAMLIGPTQSISAYDSFTIDVDLKDKKDTYKSLDNAVSKGHVLWNVHDAKNEYDIPLSKRVDGKHGSVTVNYIVLGDAVEATVEVRLLNADDQDPANVHGMITAKDTKYINMTETVLFRKPSTQFIKVSPQNKVIPLSRSVVAVPSDANLIVTANLKHSDHEIVEGTVTFPTQLSGSDEKHIKGLHGDIKVKVTWGLIKLEIYKPKYHIPRTYLLP